MPPSATSCLKKGTGFAAILQKYIKSLINADSAGFSTSDGFVFIFRLNGVLRPIFGEKKTLARGEGEWWGGVLLFFLLRGQEVRDHNQKREYQEDHEEGEEEGGGVAGFDLVPGEEGGGVGDVG